MLTVYKNQMLVEHYKEVTLVTSALIQVVLYDQKMRVKGKQLHIVALEADELLLEGEIEEIVFYEKT